MHHRTTLAFVATTGLVLGSALADETYLSFKGDASKPGKNKHVVLIAGDEEYRSEESMPMMAQLLAKQGFKTTVLFSIDNKGFVNPDQLDSLTNPVALDSADFILLDTRMRKWDDKSMSKFDAAWKRGVPFSALRTATHPFDHPKSSKWHHWAHSFKGNGPDGKDWSGGWGRQVLGETWVSHWGRHGHQGTRSYIVDAQKDHPILNGVGQIFGKTDLYEAKPLEPATVLLDGQITETLDKNSKDLAKGRGNTRMPIAWTRLYKHDSGKTNKIFTTTMGSADDLIDENLRRLVVNSVYWGLDLDVPAKVNVDYPNVYEPSFFGFRTYKKGKKPADFLNVLSPASERALKYKNIKGKPGSVRYIRVEAPGNGRILTLSEVEAISGGNNISPKGKATQSSLLKPGTPDKAIDGNKDATWGGKSLTHTAETTNNPWWELDLGDSYNVSKVNIFNRTDGNYGERLNGFTVKFLDKDRKELLVKDYLAAPKDSMTITARGKITYNKGSYPEPERPAPKVDGPKHPAVKKGTPPSALQIGKKSRIAFVGGGLGSRMNIFNEFETELNRRYPADYLVIRNLCKEGDTPAFRPHPSRPVHFVIPNGKELVPEEFRQEGMGKAWTKPSGHYETPDQWLERLQIDTVIGFFGYSESFQGEADLELYKKELRAFIQHTLAQKYTNNGPQLAIVGPAAFEDLSAKRDLPNGEKENANLKAYTEAMAQVCKEEGVLFFDTFDFTEKLYASSKADMTQNGHNLTDAAYKKLAPVLADGLFGKKEAKADYKKVKAAVAEKNRLWLLDYKIPNGVHVHGRRYKPFGNYNYPDELKKTREMTEIRDKGIWAACLGKSFNIAAADKKTHKLTPIEPDGVSQKRGNKYLSGEETLKHIKLPEGYKLQLFADEKQFPDLANPSQMAFDNKGRLWVGCMGSYPHYRIGDPLPNDKILIFEDTNGDGKADKQITFLENIHIPMGFEITPQGGAYVSLGNDLVLFEDTNGDSKADKKTIVLSGFDDHDTHHAISAFCADPSGAFFLSEGVFSYSNVETPYGTVRGTNGGFYRFNPNKGRLERTAQYEIPNPWGVAVDDWGQNFFLHTSGAAMSWMQRAATKPLYHHNMHAPNLLTSNNVRPTSGLEFVSSRHFPDEVQGDILICNNIGFLGAKQHSVEASEDGFFKVKHRQNLFVCDGEYRDRFRPVDLEFAPDGSLYFIDWCNALIGHMQHSARDPHRDHVHGRIYRVTYPSRPLVKPAKIDGAPIATLLENLKLHENRSRYRTRRELRGRDAAEVLPALKKWVAGLDKNDSKYEHHLLEALWVSWGLNQIDADLARTLLAAKDYRARTAAVRALRYNIDQFDDADALLVKAAADEHPQVRHEALIQATWVGGSTAKEMLTAFETKPIDKKWSGQAYDQAKFIINNIKVEHKGPDVKIPAHIAGDKKAAALYVEGFEGYGHGDSCAGCHQMKGEGVPNAFPPLAGSKWVTSDKDLLIKITLHGIMGEIDVKGKKYAGVMPGFAFRTPNKDIAALATYVRNAFGNKASDGDFVITEKDVERVLKESEGQKGMYQAADLLKAHPLKN